MFSPFSLTILKDCFTGIIPHYTVFCILLIYIVQSPKGGNFHEVTLYDDREVSS